jgi:uncharacterized iron-regulated membrane protein
VGEVNVTAILAALGGLLTTLGGIAVAYRKGRAEARKVEVEADQQEAEVATEEARARQKIRQDDEAWAVKQARSLYQELRDRMDALTRQERDCQIRLATIETQYADLKLAHEEMKARLARLEGGAA